MLVARALKKTWVAIGEWEGRLSKKQVEKVAKVKALLEVGRPWLVNGSWCLHRAQS